MQNLITIHCPTLEALNADIALPSSKSISNRALLLQALCPQPLYPIERLAECDDTQHMQAGIQGARTGASTIDIGATGTAMRFLTAYLAITPGTRILTGSERMQQRPISTLVEALRQLGADIQYTHNEGYPPLRITGQRLQGGDLHIQSNISSQYISALMMIGPCLERGLTLHLEGEIVSRTYIELTMGLMLQYGAHVSWADNHTLRIESGTYHDIPLTVESDWSAASYAYESAAIAASLGKRVNLLLEGLTANSEQGDRVGAELFEKLGIHTQYVEKGAMLSTGKQKVTCMEWDFTHCPDIAQTAVVTCCAMGVHFHFTGLHSLRIKETDRIHALIVELRKLGYVLQVDDNETLHWEGERTSNEECPCIATYDDHRMAMAFAPTTLLRDIQIEHPQVVSKSYPTYWDDMQNLGFEITTDKN